MDISNSIFGKKIFAIGAACTLTALLTACGGGGGEESDPPVVGVEALGNQAIVTDGNNQSIPYNLTVTYDGQKSTLAAVEDGLSERVSSRIIWNPEAKQSLKNADAFSDDAEEYVQLIHSEGNSYISTKLLNNFLDRNPEVPFPSVANLFVLEVKFDDQVFNKTFSLEPKVITIEYDFDANANGSTLIIKDNEIDVVANHSGSISVDLNALNKHGQKSTIDLSSVKFTTSNDSAAEYSLSNNKLVIKKVDAAESATITAIYRGKSTFFEVNVFPEGTNLSYDDIRIELDDTDLGVNTIPLSKPAKLNIIGSKDGGNSESILKNISIDDIEILSGKANVDIETMGGYIYLTGLKQGKTAEFEVRLGELTSKFTVNVGAFCPTGNFDVKGIDPTTINVPEGGKLDLSLKVVEDEIVKFYSKEVTWEIDNNNIATIDADGEFRGLTEGSGRVTASFCQDKKVAEFEVTSTDGDYDEVTIEGANVNRIINPFNDDSLKVKLIGLKNGSETLLTTRITWTWDVVGDSSLNDEIEVKSSGTISFNNNTASQAFDKLEGKTVTIKASYVGTSGDRVSDTETFKVGFESYTGLNYKAGDDISVSTSANGRAFSLWTVKGKEKVSNITHYTVDNGKDVFIYEPQDPYFTIDDSKEDYLILNGDINFVSEKTKLNISINPAVADKVDSTILSEFPKDSDGKLLPIALDVTITENDLIVHIVAPEGEADKWLPHVMYEDDSTKESFGSFTVHSWTADDYEEKGIADFVEFDFGSFGPSSSREVDFGIVTFEFDSSIAFESVDEDPADEPYDAADHDVCIELHDNDRSSSTYDYDLEKRERGCKDLDQKGMEIWLVPNVNKIYFSEEDLEDDLNDGLISGGKFTLTFEGKGNNVSNFVPHMWVENAGDITEWGNWQAGNVISRTRQTNDSVSFEVDLSRASNYQSGATICLLMHEGDTKDTETNRCWKPESNQYWVDYGDGNKVWDGSRNVAN